MMEIVIIVSVVLAGWAIISSVEVRSYKNKSKEYLDKIDELERELHENGTEVTVGLNDGSSVVYRKVHKIEDEGDFNVLRCYDGLIIARINKRNIVYVHGAHNVKEDAE